MDLLRSPISMPPATRMSKGDSFLGLCWNHVQQDFNLNLKCWLVLRHKATNPVSRGMSRRNILAYRCRELVSALSIEVSRFSSSCPGFRSSNVVYSPSILQYTILLNVNVQAERANQRSVREAMSIAVVPQEHCGGRQQVDPLPYFSKTPGP